MNKNSIRSHKDESIIDWDYDNLSRIKSENRKWIGLYTNDILLMWTNGE